MAEYKKENILVGAAAIYTNTAPAYALNGELTPPAMELVGLPDATTGSMDTALEGDTAWRSVGFTTGGVEVTYTPDYGAVEVDQLLDDARLFKQRMTVTVGTTLAEATLDNLVLAWGQSDETLADGATGERILTIEGGSLGERPIERQLAFVGQAPYTDPTERTERVYRLYRCLNVESSAHSLSRADATTIPVSLRCLPENNGEYGTITDRVVTEA